ncbi:hypothetical protein DSM104299_05670 [Baekduia alba]|uniref:anti-sigma factor domain-containing protein n=1 Tax=Baekduia alba TaxID=2997333 RepID=UPI00234008B0|nr:anti-sigma factor [Baekduia alba]WCB96900.1 hypothetical protein DSM104299_05670 [Baekduia alba]
MSAHRWPLSPAAVALDLVEPDERPLATRLLADEPAFRAAVDRHRAASAALVALDEDAWSPQTPPPLDRARVLDGAAGAPPPERAAGASSDPAPGAPAPTSRRPRRLRRPRRVVAALATAAAIAAAVVLVLTRSHDDDAIPAPPPTTLALRPLDGVAVRAQLVVDPSGTEAELRAAGLMPSGAHDYYEAWLADANGRMVSMGTFRVPADGRVDVHMPVAVDLSDYQLVDVSLEPDDGNPAHSDRSVLRARL